MNVLIISPEEWSAHTVSKHHYAMTLARRRATVFFLNPPDDSLKRMKIEQVEGLPDLHIVSASKVATGLRIYPAFLRRWLERRWLLRLESIIGTKIDVVWLFENSRFFDMRFAGERLKIYHQVDQSQAFHLELAASTADICFCVTDFIKELLNPFNSKVYKIPHGLAAALNPIELTVDQLGKFEQDVPQIVYIGNLDMLFLDAELLTGIVRQFSNVQFHFVGGYSKDGLLRQLAGDLPNVCWWGRVESALIPAILDQADILLVTYRAAQYREQLANSHKIIEYLGSGKTIVATYTDEYKDKRDLLEMVDDSCDYVAVFERVVKNLPDYNSTERQAQRMAFAQANTYDKQINKIITLLKQHRLIDDTNMKTL